MENSAIPDLEENKADEAVLQALLEDAKNAPDDDEAVLETLLEDAKKAPGEAALEALLARTNTEGLTKNASEDDAQAQKEKRRRERREKRQAQAQTQSELGTVSDRSRATARTTRGSSDISRSTTDDRAVTTSDRATKNPASYKAQMLIVHADSTQRSVLEMSFISEGYDVVNFETGKEALGFLKTNVPDIMLLDADMEKLTGMDICFRIRKIKRFEKVPVIIMTESVDDRTETMVKMCHANDFFPKAHKNIELKAKVRKLLDNDDLEKLTQVDVV